MKSDSLTLALAIAVMGTTGVANAVTLNPRGLGQVLIYPYYTVNKNQDTLITVVNTTAIGKAIKVHFGEGYNGRGALFFNLFLSPQDVWTARISQTAGDGGAAIFTSDHSCTYPTIVPTGQPFRASGYAGGGFPPDGGPTSITRTREGSVELFEMGEIIPGSDLDNATTHIQHGTPGGGIPDCSQAVIGNAAGAGLSIPAGGLFGTGAIVNVGDGTFFSYNADAIDGFSDRTLFSLSGDSAPTLQDANNVASSSPGGAIAQVVNDRGTLLSLDYANGVDAVSAIFMADSIYNEYLVAAGLGAHTDWIVNFPTRAFYTDPLYIGTGAALPPFFERVHAGISNVEVEGAVFDLEEGFLPPSGSFPGQDPPFVLPYQVNALRFFTGSSAPTGPSGVFGSTLTPAAMPSSYGDAGWLRLGLASGDTIGHALRPDHAGKRLHGLPVTGFMAYNIVNANAAPGKLANYGGTFAHRANVSCTQSDAPQPLACH